MQQASKLTAEQKHEIQENLEKIYAREFTAHFKANLPVLENSLNQTTSRLYQIFQEMFKELRVEHVDDDWMWNDNKAKAFYEVVSNLFKEGDYQKAFELTIKFHLYHFNLRLFERQYNLLKELIEGAHSIKDEIDEMQTVSHLNKILDSYGMDINGRKNHWFYCNKE